MKAAIYYGPEDIKCGEKADPSITEDHQILPEQQQHSNSLEPSRYN